MSYSGLPNQAGEQGFEPQIPRPERGVLPLHHSPKRAYFTTIIRKYLEILYLGVSNIQMILSFSQRTPLWDGVNDRRE